LLDFVLGWTVVLDIERSLADVVALTITVFHVLDFEVAGVVVTNPLLVDCIVDLLVAFCVVDLVVVGNCVVGFVGAGVVDGGPVVDFVLACLVVVGTFVVDFVVVGGLVVIFFVVGIILVVGITAGPEMVN